MLTRDKTFYKLIVSIAVPIALQNLITFAVSMADSIMVGSLGEQALSAVTLANQLFFIFMILCFGIGSGANVLISQYWGKEDIGAIHKIIAIVTKISIVAALIFMVIAVVFPGQFMTVFSKDPVIIEQGTQYLRVIFISYIFFAITNIIISALRSVQTVRISLVVYGASLIVNVCLNYVLIFGNFGAPRLGVQGAAIATTIARLVEFIIALFFIVFFEKKIKFKPKSLLMTDKLLVKDFWKVGGPVIANELVWVLGSSVLSFIVALMGTETVAANSINSVVWQFVSVFIMGVGNAAAVMIGNTIGQEDYTKAKEYGNTFIIIAIILGIIGGIIMYGIRPYVLLLYNVSDLTKGIAMQIMTVGALILVFQSLGFILMMGILRGGGDTKFVLIADVLFLWGIAIPLGYIGLKVFGFSVPVVYLLLRSEELIKAVAAVIRVMKGKWIKNVTR
ncbi:MATE family efflux transporter [Sporanaerobium hydrogeniformans]|uniref:MATE family efflux transporter n=2 Tax=Sporanaerobium hydrogeniformans TaxID=3072179 RepID=A0AC61DDH7_9FIRM|nr:MATE family efflux transporter [Sporanaerobium hydrogeniformans]